MAESTPRSRRQKADPLRTPIPPDGWAPIGHSEAERLRQHIDIRFLEVAGRFDGAGRRMGSIEDRLGGMEGIARDHQDMHNNLPSKSQSGWIAASTAVVISIVAGVIEYFRKGGS